MIKMSKRTKLLKKRYLKDFIEYQAELIKNRVIFFCLLSLIIYLLGTAMSFVIIPRVFLAEEIDLLKFLFVGAFVIYFLVKRTRSIGFAKFCAYIYTGLLLYVLTRLNIIYPAALKISGVTYIFALFLVCFSIPWHPFETFNLTTMHIAAFTLLFMYINQNMPEEINSSFDVFYYFASFIFLCMGFVLTFMVRRKEARKELENFVLLKEQSLKNQQFREELNLASRVYETLVPQSQDTELIDIDVVYIPVSYMSGDYAKYYFIDKDLLIFIICDITGHGVSAALLVNRMHTEFVRLVREDKEPGDILKELNSFIYKEFGDINMYMSAFCGLVDLQEMRLVYSNYGHPAQYLYSNQEFRVKGMPSEAAWLGVMENMTTDLEKMLPLNKGDRIVLFTDGLIEVKNKEQKEYGKGRLEKFILDNPFLVPKAFNQSLLDEIYRFKKGDFKDDIFLINIMIKK
jgi:serine phosphatase RsbU (regulator of sigma subunit)